MQKEWSMNFQQKGFFPLNQRTMFYFSSWVRLLALSLLLGFGLMTGSAFAGRTVHAQPLNTVLITDCPYDTQLQNAIANASSGETIMFYCNGVMPITKTLTITTNLTLEACPGCFIALTSAGMQTFYVNSGVNFTFNSVTVTESGTNIDSPFNMGGGIDNNGGTVNISNSTFDNNIAYSGGGIDNNGGTVNI